MKIAYPWITTSGRRHYRFNKIISDSGIFYIAFVYLNIENVWIWSCRVCEYDPLSNNMIDGESASEKAAMEEADECLRNHGWKLINDKHHSFL